MKEAIQSKRSLIEYYENARESFAAKMRSEDDERSNLKFKIASFVIHELSYSTPSWFKKYFMTHIARTDHDEKITDEKIINVENTFYDVVADYLIKMESEVEYVKKALALLKNDEEKKEFWQPVVFDSFLIVGIYFMPTLQRSKKSNDRSIENKKERNVNPRYLNYQQTKYNKNMTICLNKNVAAAG